LRIENIIESVKKTGRLVVVDGDWSTCGMAGEIIAKVMENIEISHLKKSPVRITLPDAPAPTSKVLEDKYYIKESDVLHSIRSIMK
jgi:pyruvate dehydrogenase E1 component beta subunit